MVGYTMTMIMGSSLSKMEMEIAQSTNCTFTERKFLTSYKYFQIQQFNEFSNHSAIMYTLQCKLSPQVNRFI